MENSSAPMEIPAKKLVRQLDFAAVVAPEQRRVSLAQNALNQWKRMEGATMSHVYVANLFVGFVVKLLVNRIVGQELRAIAVGICGNNLKLTLRSSRAGLGSHSILTLMWKGMLEISWKLPKSFNYIFSVYNMKTGLVKWSCSGSYDHLSRD
ncbi:hypothetical protein Droror1_Dr00025537 [Drosera rotundifolia]